MGKLGGAGEDNEPLSGARHGDVAVDCALDASAEGVGVDQDDEVELEAFGCFGSQ